MPEGSIRIPFNRPYLTGRELEYMQESMNSGNIVGDGEYTHKCEDLLEKTFSLSFWNMVASLEQT